MARLYSSGFELNSLTAGMEWTLGGSANATIDSTTKRSGSYSGKVTSANGVRHGFVQQFIGSANAGPYYLRAYIYVTAYPNTSGSSIMTFSSGTTISGGAIATISMATDGTLSLQYANGAGSVVDVGNDTSALSLNTWYRVELLFDNSGGAGNGIIRGYLDGVEFGNGTGLTFLSNVLSFRLTTNGLAQSQTAHTIYFDDVALNDGTGSAQNSLPGSGKIVHLRPNASGDNAPDLGTFADIDEVTPDDATTFIDLDTAIPADFNVDSSATAGIGSSDTITLVSVGARIREESSTTTSYQLRIKSASGGTTSTSTASDAGDTTWRTNPTTTNNQMLHRLVSYTDPTTTSAWTPTGTNSLDNMQIGVAMTTGTADFDVSALWALVEYIPSSNQALTLVADVASFVLTGVTTGLLQALKMAGAVGEFALTGISNVLTYGQNMVASAGSFTLTGVSANFLQALKLTAETGTFVLTGVANTLKQALTMGANVASFVLTGVNNTLTYGQNMVASAGAFTLSGIDAGFTSARRMASDVGNFVLTGISNTLTYTPQSIAFGGALGKNVSGGVSSLSLTSLTVSGSNPVIIVAVRSENVSRTHTGVTWDNGSGGNSQSFTKLGGYLDLEAVNHRLSFWYLTNPNLSNSRITATINSSDVLALSAVYYTGVDQTYPFKYPTFTVDTASGGNSVDISDLDGSWHIGLGISSNGGWSSDTGCTNRQNITTNTGEMHDSNGTVAEGASHTFNYSWSGGGNSGWITTMMRPAFTAGDFSLDLEADSAQHVAIADASQTGLDLTDALTFESWVKFESISAQRALISKRVASGNQRSYYWFWNNDNTLNLEWHTDGSSAGGAVNVSWTPIVDVWYHLAVTKTGTSVKFYVNGGQQGSTQTGSNGTIHNGTAPFEIGRWIDGPSYMDGYMKDVRVFNDVRTQAEIISDAHTENVSDGNLQGEWNFNANLLDSTANNNDLTASGSPLYTTNLPWEGATDVDGSRYLEDSLVAWWTFDTDGEDAHSTNDLTASGSPTFVTAKKGNGADFESGSSQYFSIADNASLSITGDESIAFWYMPESSSTAEYFFISKGTATDGSRGLDFAYEINGALTNFYLQTSGNGTNVPMNVNWTFGSALTTGQWYHVAVALDTVNGRAEMWLNGISYGIKTGSAGSQFDNSNPFYIGRSGHSSSFRYQDGIMDEVSVYSRALHYGDVLDLYNAGNGIAYVGGLVYNIVASVGDFVLTGIATGFTKALNMGATVADFVLTGVNAGLSLGKGLIAEVGTFTLTGIDNLFHVALNMATTVGEFTLTGIDVALAKTKLLVADTVAFTLTGIDATIGLALRMATAVGEFTLTGISNTLTKGYNMVVTVGEFILTGFSVFVPIMWRTPNKNSVSMTNTDKNDETWVTPDKNSESFTNSVLKHLASMINPDKNNESWVTEDKTNIPT